MLWIAVAFGVIAGGVIQSVTGFGSAVVMMMVFPYFLDMVAAPALSSAINVGLTPALAWKFRKYIDWKIAVPPIIAYLATSLPILNFVQDIDLDVLTIVFGVFLIVLSIYFFIFADRIHVEGNWKTALICGAISGVTSAFFGIGGPVLAIYFVSATKSKEEYLGNFQFHFAVSNTVNFIMRISKGIYTLDLVPLTIIGILGIHVGKKLGLKILDKINVELMRKIVYAFVGISGAIKVLQQIF